MGIKEEDVARVRAASDLVQIAGEHLALRKVGRRWVGLCPFHAEKTPSFSVNAEEGLYYCLAGETRVLTWDGPRAIRELAGTRARVLTEQGRWVTAPFFSFGVQPLMRVTVGRNRQTKVIHATPEHRWLVRGRGTHRYERTTQNLRPGHNLAWSFPQNRLRHLGGLSPFGIAHGITYGAGTRFGPAAALDLHGDKDAQLLKWFPHNRTYQCTTANGTPYVKVLDLPRAFKERPRLDEAPSYLAGWLAGYLAADGHVAADGTFFLSSAERADLEFVRDVCTRLGLGTYGITEQRRVGLGQDGPSECVQATQAGPLYRVHFVTEDLDERMFLLDEHRLRFTGSEEAWTRRGWVVRSVAPTDRLEEVFCAVVEGTHSFVLEDNILTGNCFGCGAKGDVITFVREVEHLEFAEAVERLAARAGISISYDDAAVGRERQRRAVLVDAMAEAVEWYHQRLLTAPDAAPARSYLRSRGYDGEVVRNYKLGWAPGEWDALCRALRVPLDVLTDTGLGLLNRLHRQQDTFRNRIMFPIFDVRGDPVAFGGRALPGGEPPKYRNSPETPLYSKSRVLYGLNWAKGPVVAAGEVVVCEGYTDVIGLASVGVPTAVATCGTALADQHVHTLKNFARRLVLAYDADAAGRAAAGRFYEWERRYELDIAVATLPAGSDPGDLAGKDPEGLRAAVAEARPFLAFRLEQVLATADLRSAEGRARAASAALAVIAEHPDDLVRDQYVMEVADRTRIDPDRLRAQLAQGPRTVARPPASRRRPPRGGPEIEALRVAVHQPEALSGRLAPVLFADDVARAAWRALDGAESLHAAIEVADPEAAALLQRLAVEETDADPTDVLVRLADEAARRALAELDAEARTADDPVGYAPLIGWLKLTMEELREPATAVEAADRLVRWLVEREGESGRADWRG